MFYVLFGRLTWMCYGAIVLCAVAHESIRSSLGTHSAERAVGCFHWDASSSTTSRTCLLFEVFSFTIHDQNGGVLPLVKSFSFLSLKSIAKSMFNLFSFGKTNALIQIKMLL